MSLMVGLSVTAAPLLRLIPMSVLFGVFLYMGIASMSGVQFFDRYDSILLFILFQKTFNPILYSIVRLFQAWTLFHANEISSARTIRAACANMENAHFHIHSSNGTGYIVAG